MLVEFAILCAGLLTILVLSDIVIRDVMALANHYGLSGTFMGLTVLSIGTSIPEIMSHVVASLTILADPSQFDSMSALVIGANIGSDIFQQHVLLGLLGLLGVVSVSRHVLNKEAGALVLATAMIMILGFNGIISRFEGLILLVLYVMYLVYVQSDTKPSKKKQLLGAERYWFMVRVLVAFGIMGFAAQKALSASQIIVANSPISASFFGVLVLGIVSALPELMTALMGVINAQKDMSIGVLFGSNVTNPLLGIGLGALISKYSVPLVSLWYDLPFKLVTAILLFVILRRYRRLGRTWSIALIALYITYLFVRGWIFPTDVF